MKYCQKDVDMSVRDVLCSQLGPGLVIEVKDEIVLAWCQLVCSEFSFLQFCGQVYCQYTVRTVLRLSTSVLLNTSSFSLAQSKTMTLSFRGGLNIL